MEQLRLSRVLQAKPLRPALPLVVLLRQSARSVRFSPDEVAAALNLDWCVGSGCVSEYSLVAMGDDVEEPALSEQVSDPPGGGGETGTGRD